MADSIKSMSAMLPLKVGRYTEADRSEFVAWVEPPDRTWILFLRKDGTPVLYPNRDPKTGAVIGSAAVSWSG